MKQNRESDMRLSIEMAVDEAIRVSGESAVKDAFSMFGAKGIDDLPEHSYEQVFSELTRLASD